MIIDPRPLFEADQVLTQRDLLAFERALTNEYRSIRWFSPIKKWSTGVAIGVVIGLLTWIQQGKGQIKGEIN